MEKIQPREKLEKFKDANSNTGKRRTDTRKYLKVVNEIPVSSLADIVYAMGNAITEKMGIKKKKEARKSRPGNGNRRERKMKAEMKQLRQKIARVSNELHRRKQKKSDKEGENDTQIEGLNSTTKTLIRYKEI